MDRKLLKHNWRRLDNTAKIFSIEEKKNINTFRLSVVLTEKVDVKVLKKAVNKALKTYPSYGVKIKTGFFWNYLETNLKEVIVEVEEDRPCKTINLKENNDYLFKVTYFNNKINLDVYHVLTDGLGATIFLKEIIYNYLNQKYKFSPLKKERIKDTYSNQDQNIKNADKKLTLKEKGKKVFTIEDKSNYAENKTYHYILNLKDFKDICRTHPVSVSEYLTALYIYAIYKSIYRKHSNKDIVVTVPIDLRKKYNVTSFTNFFTCMNIEAGVDNNKKVTFKEILNQVHKEYKDKLTNQNVEKYLSRDVKLGTNIGIRLVPLFIKKFVIRHFGKFLSRPTTTTLSNIGVIKIADKYKKYIENIMVLVSPGKSQKVKCTVCSFENKLTVTLNSNLINNKLEDEFHKILLKYVGGVKLESNNI